MRKLLLLLLPWLFTACSSTRITQSWMSDTIPSIHYQRMLVVALISENDRSLQEQMEQHFVADLRELGYQAVSSLNEYGPKAFQGKREEEVISQLSKSGVDAVISIVLLDKEKERRYVPGNVIYSPFSYYHSRFWHYYGMMQYRVYQPGYYVTDTKYFWETNFYSSGGAQLIYSAQTRSFDPSSASGMAHEYGKKVIADMLRKGILVRP